MHYRCAHCYAPLELIDEELIPCLDHPDGAIEWSVDQAEWEPVEGDNELP
jgi:hypothetical protein